MIDWSAVREYSRFCDEFVTKAGLTDAVRWREVRSMHADLPWPLGAGCFAARPASPVRRLMLTPSFPVVWVEAASGSSVPAADITSRRV